MTLFVQCTSCSVFITAPIFVHVHNLPLRVHHLPYTTIYKLPPGNRCITTYNVRRTLLTCIVYIVHIHTHLYTSPVHHHSYITALTTTKYLMYTVTLTRTVYGVQCTVYTNTNTHSPPPIHYYESNNRSNSIKDDPIVKVEMH